MSTDYYLQQIKAERQRQDEKWGEQNHHPSFWVSIMGEEFGEMCKSLNEYMSEHDANHFDDMKAEAIQVAAVAVAMLECFDRNTLAEMSIQEFARFLSKNILFTARDIRAGDED